MTGGSRAKVIGGILLAVLLAGCGGVAERAGRGSIPLEGFTAEQIFERGEFEMERSQPDTAAFYFSEIERLYPYSEWAKRGFYPADDDAAYAQYLLALSYYDQIDDVGRDQGLTFQALQALRTVIEVYPDSDYATSAVLKFDLAFDHLAGKEMEIGRYYLRRNHHTAAVNRFRVVVQDFQTTSHTAEALHRLVEAYLSLGLTQEAQTAGAILGHNFRSTTWYADSYKLLTGRGLELEAAGDSWLAQIYRQTIRGQWL